jgi:Uma2 family endonuclease
MQTLYRMPTSERLVTAEEFARIPDDDHRYELVEGRVIRMSPSGSRHAVLATRIAVILTQYVDSRNLGVVMTTGGFKIATGPDTVREPDVAFVRRDRVPGDGVPEGFWPGPADLVVEINSPGDRKSEILAKVADYLRRGVPLVWVVDSRKQIVTTYRRPDEPVVHGLEDLLDAPDVIDGFTCPVRRVFEGIVPLKS